MLSLYTASTVLSAASRPSFAWSAKHGVRFVLPAVKPTHRITATPSTVFKPVQQSTKPAFNAFEARERRNSFFSRQTSSTVRTLRLASSISTSLRVLVVRRKAYTVTVKSDSPSSAIVAVDVTSTPSDSSSQLPNPAVEATILPPVESKTTLDANVHSAAPHTLATTPSTRQENAQPALSSFSDLTFLYGYALPLTIVAHSLSSLTPVSVEPEQLNSIVRKLPFFF